jgi:hypothetical protein
MSDEDERMAEAAEKLDSALESTDEEAAEGTETTSTARDETKREGDTSNQQSGGSDSTAFIQDVQQGLSNGLLESLGARDTDSAESGLGEQFGRLLGEMVVRKLAERLRRRRDDGNDASIEAFDPNELLGSDSSEASTEAPSDEGLLSEVAEGIETGQQIVGETGELLDTVDLSELSEAIDFSELPDAIDAEGVPAAIANADPKRAVKLKQLASLVEFDELWDAVEVQEFMQNKEEFEDAVGDVSDGESGASSLIDSLGSSDSGESGDGSLIEREEAMQAAIQSKLSDAIEEFRESALDARDQLKAARDTAQEEVEEKTGGGPGQPSSRNPTAYSTMVGGWTSSGWSSANFSTVPQSTRHSNAPGHFRIYGRRFDEREDDDE